MPFSGPWDLQTPGSMCFLLGSFSYILYVHSFGHLWRLFAGLILLSVLLLTYPADVLGLVNSPLNWDFQLGQERPEWEAKSQDERGWSVNKERARSGGQAAAQRSESQWGWGSARADAAPQSWLFVAVDSGVCRDTCGLKSSGTCGWIRGCTLSLSVSIICHLVIHEIAQETLAASLCLVSL